MNADREEAISNISNTLSVFILGILAILSATQAVSVCKGCMAAGDLSWQTDTGRVYSLLAPALSMLLYLFGCIMGLKRRLSTSIVGYMLGALFSIKGIAEMMNVVTSADAFVLSLFFFASACSAFLLFCKEQRKPVWILVLYAVALNGIVRAVIFFLGIIPNNNRISLESLFLYMWTILQVSLFICINHILQKPVCEYERDTSELKYHIALALLHCPDIVVILILVLGASFLPMDLYAPLIPLAISSPYYWVYFWFPLFVIVAFLLSVYRIWRASWLKKIPYILWCVLSTLEILGFYLPFRLLMSAMIYGITAT